jgi:hypothetical protein
MHPFDGYDVIVQNLSSLYPSHKTHLFQFR